MPIRVASALPMRATPWWTTERWGAAALGALLVLSPLFSTGADADTLAQALAFAYRSNPQLNAERARQRADDHAVRAALSGFYPMAALNAEVGAGFERDGGDRRSAFARQATVGVSVNQTITDFGRTAAAVSRAESGVLAGREALRGVEQTVLLAAVAAYMNILRDRAVVELQGGNIVFLTEQARIARKRVETGDLRPTDAAQAEARLARGRTELALAEANLLASRAAYRQAVGRDAVNLAFPVAEPRVPAGLREARQEGLGRSPAIRNAQQVVDIAAADVNAAEAALRPSLGVTGSASRTFGRRIGDESGSPFGAAAGLTVPIYNGGAEYALIRQAKETLGQRRFELETARDQVQADIRNAWGVLEAARASVPAVEASIAANEIALAGVSREASEGGRTTLDVLNAQQELVNSRAALIVARRDRVVAGYGLLAAAGGLTASRLRLAGERYSPETHYRQVRDLDIGTRTPDGR